MLKIFITLFYLIVTGVTSAQVKTFQVRGTSKSVTLKEGYCVADPTVTFNPEQQSKIQVITKHLGVKQVDHLAKQLGNDMSHAMNRDIDINRYLHDKILKSIGSSREDKSFKEDVQSFWNTYNEKLVCRKKVPGISSRDTQHILKRLVDYRNVGFVKRFMNGRKHPLNPNAIELVNGEPETLLDYLNKITSNKTKYINHDYTEIENLKLFLKKSFGAKTAGELLIIN